MTKLVCSVATCLHNCDNRCCKGAIMVDGESARTPEATCCASFDERTKDTFCNKFETPDEKLEVSCDAVNCIYNEMHVCHADKIGISGNDAKKSDQTECATFKMR